MKKIYLVYSTDVKPFDKLVDYVRTRFSNIIKIDTEHIIFEKISRAIEYEDYAPMMNHNTMLTVNKISKLLNTKYDNSYLIITHKIKDGDSDRKLIFVRISDLTMITRLKRKYKRDKYVTIRIDNAEQISIVNKAKLVKYEFDVIINNVSPEILDKQIVKVVRKRVPSINFINKREI